MLKIDETIIEKKTYSLGFATDNDVLKLYSLKKSTPSNDRARYHIRINTLVNNNNVNLGYIYFYLDVEEKTSDFIGMFVNDKYRSLGLGTDLIATWLKLCFENDIFNIYTNKKQRKPFLLHILKKFGFEITDRGDYDRSRAVIYIGKGIDKSKKYILFKSSLEKMAFEKTRVYKSDNYVILEKEDDTIPLIDRVILCRPYYLICPHLAIPKINQLSFKHKMM